MRKFFHASLIGLIIFILLSTLSQIGLFNSWQVKLTDTLFTKQPAPNNIVIIAIDDKSIGEIGKFPWDRRVYANFLNNLNKQSITPKAIGIDISFLEKSNDKSDSALAKAISDYKSTKIILASEISGKNILLPIEILRKNSISAYVNTTPDSDGVVRKIPNLQTSNLKSFAQNLSNRSETGKINFLGPSGTFKVFPFSDVLNNKINSSDLNNKIVLVGATAPDLHDDQAVPTDAKMSGIEIQANIINTLQNQAGKKDEAKILSILTILLISIISSIIFTFLSPVMVMITGVIFSLFYAIYTTLSFDNGTIRNIIYPLLAIILSAVANIIYKYLTESKEKKFIRKTFSYYLSEPVLNHLLKNPHKIALGGERKELTVLFSDIAGFTSISEKMKANELAILLNNYLTKMTEVVFENAGVLDKYIGDAIMAFWGAPVEEDDHAYLACSTALKMQEVISKNFDFTARVGINSGEMVVGNMGSHQRFDYSLLGDNVNLGSRLEGINKYYGTKICISENTYKKVEGRVTARKLDIVAVKGKKTGIPIYELRGLGIPNEKEKIFLNNFEEARALYEKSQFKKSLTLFEKLNKKYKDDGPILTYIERIKELIQNPPENWDGVYHATSK